MALNTRKNSKVLAQSNDQQLFLDGYDTYAPKIFRFIYYKVSKHKQLAEDLTQQTFFKTWEYLQSNNQSIQYIQAFLYQTARNLVIDHYRTRDKDTLELFENGTPADAGQPRWQEKIEARVDLTIIDNAIQQIPEQYQEIIMLRFMEELTIEEIAQVLEKNKNNIYVMIHRALNSLREILEEKGHTATVKNLALESI